MNLRHWAQWALRVWPNSGQRTAVAAQYAQLHNLTLMMADLALRNHVLSPLPKADNLFQAGIAEGRRQCVLDLMKLSRLDPLKVAALGRKTNRGDHDD